MNDQKISDLAELIVQCATLTGFYVARVLKPNSKDNKEESDKIATRIGELRTKLYTADDFRNEISKQKEDRAKEQIEIQEKISELINKEK